MLGGILDFVLALGNTSVEVYEWDESDVRTKRLPNAPNFSKLTTQRANMGFNGWSLAHAVVKADYLDRRNLTMPGIAFLLQAGNLIDFGASPIELKPGASKALNDFSLTSLSGRVGQGLAILYGQSLGMKFTAHLRSHVESLPAGSPGEKHKGSAMADFLFANGHQTVLIESKGSFTLKENDPTEIKSVLKDALQKQIDPWMGYLQPAPINGYVVYSCLREGSGLPSALFVVDPEEVGDQTPPVPFSQEQVFRENYGAWLRAMGLYDAAHRLIQSSGEGPQAVEERFLIEEFGGRKYAFREAYYGRPYLRRWPAPSIGLDLEALRAIEAALHAPNASLRELLVGLPEPIAESQQGASVFPDGSILGPIRARPLELQVMRL